MLLASRAAAKGTQAIATAGPTPIAPRAGGEAAATGAGAKRGAGACAARGPTRAGTGGGAILTGAGAATGTPRGPFGARGSGGSSASGSRYPWLVPALRTPRCRCGPSDDGDPLVPLAPIRSPAATVCPAWTAAAERCRYETSWRPSAVRTETVSPDEPAVPANRTVPPAAATTGVPGAAAMSIPRCRPPA